MIGAATAFAFGVWRYSIDSGHDGFVRFFENIMTYSFIGLWLGSTTVGLKVAAVFLKKNSRKNGTVFAAIAILANIGMVIGSIWVAFNYYSVELTFKSDSELIALLNDPADKWAASYKLGVRRVAEAVPVLCALLEDVNEEVNLRHDAAIALGKICAPPYQPDTDRDAAIKALTAVLKDADDLLLSTVATALGEVKDERAVIPLGKVVQNESHSRYTRLDAARAIGNIGGAQALRTLSSIREVSRDGGFRKSLEDIILPVQNQEAIKSMKETLNP